MAETVASVEKSGQTYYYYHLSILIGASSMYFLDLLERIAFERRPSQRYLLRRNSWVCFSHLVIQHHGFPTKATYRIICFQNLGQFQACLPSFGTDMSQRLFFSHGLVLSLTS